MKCKEISISLLVPLSPAPSACHFFPSPPHLPAAGSNGASCASLASPLLSPFARLAELACLPACQVCPSSKGLGAQTSAPSLCFFLSLGLGLAHSSSEGAGQQTAPPPLPPLLPSALAPDASARLGQKPEASGPLNYRPVATAPDPEQQPSPRSVGLKLRPRALKELARPAPAFVRRPASSGCQDFCLPRCQILAARASTL